MQPVRRNRASNLQGPPVPSTLAHYSRVLVVQILLQQVVKETEVVVINILFSYSNTLPRVSFACLLIFASILYCQGGDPIAKAGTTRRV